MSNSTKVTIVDYDSGNLWSVKNALIYLGYEPEITSCPEKIRNSRKLILPGVGSFAYAMKSLKEKNIDQAIRDAVIEKGASILGICLGMQLLGSRGTEDGITEGINLIPTDVDVFNKDILEKLKTPHIGFNKVLGHPKSKLFKGLDRETDFYFVHSYRMVENNIDGYNGICFYGEEFMALYENENIFATQFHPEKSQNNGLIVLNNFLQA